MKAVVFGAGKIARGFLAQLLQRSGFSITFVESWEPLVRALSAAGRYYVNVMGNPAMSEWIESYSCVTLGDKEAILHALLEADVAFTSVGGKNLEGLGEVIARAFQSAPGRERSFVTCENWKQPAEVLEWSILANLPDDGMRAAFKAQWSVTQAVIMRSAVEPTNDVLAIDPLAVSVSDYWDLPIDASRWLGLKPDILGARYLDNFKGFLQQKIYTYNGGNATIAYLGALKGHTLLSDAAGDPEIVAMLRTAYDSINPAVAAELDIPLQDQVEFSCTAIRKYADPHIVDFVERHARDPIRKLSPDDRIVGVARLVERHGCPVMPIAATIAAAAYYDSANLQDPSAEELRRLRRSAGAAGVLKEVCKILPSEPLYECVLGQIAELKKRGWIREA